jgi:hypothetical protein
LQTVIMKDKIELVQRFAKRKNIKYLSGTWQNYLV